VRSTGFRSYVLPPVLAVLAAAIFSMPAVAQLQPGSTIGKTGKSSSGGEEQSEPSSRPRREAPTTERSTGSSCQKIVGTWNWDGGDAVFGPNGSVRHSLGHTASWRCSGGTVVAVWGNLGITDRITIAPDGNSVSVANSNGKTFSGTRK